MNYLKTLRDFLNALDLDNVQPVVEIVYHSEDGIHCEDMVSFQLVEAEGNNLPYLSLHTESFVQDLIDF